MLLACALITQSFILDNFVLIWHILMLYNFYIYGSIFISFLVRDFFTSKRDLEGEKFRVDLSGVIYLEDQYVVE